MIAHAVDVALPTETATAPKLAWRLKEVGL